MFKHMLLVIAVLFAAPSITLAQSEVYPNLSEVLAATYSEKPINETLLVQEVAGAAQNLDDLSALAIELQRHLPQASDAEIADIMIAAYTDYLNTDAARIDERASLAAFEKVVYNDVFADSGEGRIVEDSNRPEGWLFD